MIVTSLYLGLLIGAALHDVLRFTIPNWVHVALAALFAGAALAYAPAGFPWVEHLGAGVLLFAIGAALFYFNLMGGGDAKLIGAVGLWVGFDGLLPFVLIMALAGGALALVVMLLRLVVRKLLPPKAEAKSWPELIARRKDLPYGVAIAAGAIAVLGRTPLLTPLF